MDYKYNKIILVVVLVALVVASVFILKPEIKGDGVTYLEAMEVLVFSEIPENFTPNRILTTFLGLETAILFSKILGSMNGWLVMNIIFYFISAIIFYNLLLKIFDNEKIAFLGTLFLAGNYAMLRFGLNFLMDLGGWMFYLGSLYFVWNYLEDKSTKNLLFASFCVAIGGLFKEYAYFGLLPIIGILLYENYRQLFVFVKKIIIPCLIIFVPTVILHTFVYLKFNYTYLDWLSSNQEHYVYGSRVAEYVKSFGSLLNISGILFIFGLVTLRKVWANLDSHVKSFLLLIFISIIPIFFWPAITQRVLFIAVPFVILISTFFIKKYQKYWYAFIPVLAIYVFASFFMDSHILPNINLPL